MICAYGEMSTPKVRPKVCAHNNHRQHLSARRTIPSLRKAKASAGIGDNHFPIPLNLVQNTPYRKKTGVRVQNESCIFCGKTQNGSTYKASFEFLKRCLLTIYPNEWGPFHVSATRGSASETAIISYEAYKLAHRFHFVRRMPVPDS